ncbi:MAG: hypothetical protein ACKVHL_10040, partial [Rhodospirillales bacterium]
MADKRFNKSQIIIFLALVVFASSLWIGRNFVGGIFSDSYAAGDTSKKKKKRSKRAVPVIVKPISFACNTIRIEAI